MSDRKTQLTFADVDAYLHKVTPSRHRVLQSMERYARKHGFPIIGPLAGRFLYQMAVVSRARKVLELGSGFGYSAFWFSLAMGKRGKILMTDGDENNKRLAEKYLDRAGLESTFAFVVGDAIETASNLKGPYDIILNDIDKHGYPDTIDGAARLLRPGGLFITDNIIWSGRVLDRKVRDKDTRGIRKFTKLLYKDPRFFTTIVPIRDGLAVAMRQE